MSSERSAADIILLIEGLTALKLARSESARSDPDQRRIATLLESLKQEYRIAADLEAERKPK